MAFGQKKDCNSAGNAGRKCGPLAIAAALFCCLASPAAAQGTNADAFLGGYLGTHIGYGTADTTLDRDAYTIPVLPSQNDVPVPARRDSFDFNGGLIGIHAGYNHVTAGNWLFGIEGDWTHLEMKEVKTASQTITFGGENFIQQHRSKLDLDWQATVRGRVGFITGNTLFFGTAGVAFMDYDWREAATVTDVDVSQTFGQHHSENGIWVGFVVGGGFEYAVTESVSIGADYLYEHFGDLGRVPFGHTNPAQQGKLDDLDMHKVRARISIKLGTP